MIQVENSVSYQPPSGGCVLKQEQVAVEAQAVVQPPSGGCVLKRTDKRLNDMTSLQPPSGGCVLKPCLPIWSAFWVFSRLQAAVC